MRFGTVFLGVPLLILASGSVMAASSPTEERVGVGLGLTVGAIAGGPVGAIIGGAIGARFGDNYYRKNEKISALTTSLGESSERVVTLERTIVDLNRDVSVLDSDLRRLQSQARPRLLALLQAGIEMDLLFRTDEHVLADDTRSRVGQLASTLSSMPDVRIKLDGFADQRGDGRYNRQLSAQRADHIRQLLVDNGVSAQRIQITAHGESPAMDTTADSYALERKVSLTLYVKSAESVASTSH